MHNTSFWNCENRGLPDNEIHTIQNACNNYYIFILTLSADYNSVILYLIYQLIEHKTIEQNIANIFHVLYLPYVTSSTIPYHQNFNCKVNSPVYEHHCDLTALL